jgi:hypothetical protein
MEQYCFAGSHVSCGPHANGALVLSVGRISSGGEGGCV